MMLDILLLFIGNRVQFLWFSAFHSKSTNKWNSSFSFKRTQTERIRALRRKNQLSFFYILCVTLYFILCCITRFFRIIFKNLGNNWTVFFLSILTSIIEYNEYYTPSWFQLPTLKLFRLRTFKNVYRPFKIRELVTSLICGTIERYV